MSAVDGFLAPVITEVLLAALAGQSESKEAHHLYLGSPWLSDFPLFAGVFAGSFPYLLPDAEPGDVQTIGDVLATWRKYGGDVTLIVQNYDRSDWPKKDQAARNVEELKLLERCVAAGVEVVFAKGFHSKFIVVPDVVVSGSANMTYYGFYRNFEHLHVHRRAIAQGDYETERQVCMNHVATARGLGSCAPPHKLTGRVAPSDILQIRETLNASKVKDVTTWFGSGHQPSVAKSASDPWGEVLDLVDPKWVPLLSALREAGVRAPADADWEIPVGGRVSDAHAVVVWNPDGKPVALAEALVKGATASIVVVQPDSAPSEIARQLKPLLGADA